MALRRTFGWFTTHLDAWRDAREDRRETAAAIATASAIVRKSGAVTSLSTHTDRNDLAA